MSLGDFFTQEIAVDVLTWVPVNRQALDAITWSCRALEAASTRLRSWIQFMQSCAAGCHVRVHRHATAVCFSCAHQPSAIQRVLRIHCDAVKQMDASGGAVDNATFALISVHASLEVLHLSNNCAISCVAPLSCHARMRVLDLRNANVDNAAVRVLRSCEELQVLSLSCNTEVTDVRALSDHPKLASLDLSRTSISDAGIDGLQQCPCLATLLLCYCEGVSEVGFLASSRSLKELDISYTKFTAGGLGELVLCPTVESVRMEGCRTNELYWGCNGAVTGPSVKRLNLSMSYRLLRSWACWFDFLALEEMRVEVEQEYFACEDPRDCLRVFLESLPPRLRELHLTKSFFIDKFSAFPALSNLAKLALPRAGLTSEAVSIIGSCCGMLECLDLSSNWDISDLTPLKNCSRLTHVDVLFTNVGDVDALASCLELQSVKAGSQTFVYSSPTLRAIRDVSALCRCLLLTTLHLHRCLVCENGTKDLSKCQNLQSLTISECPSLSHLRNLCMCSALRYLDLSSTGMTTEGLEGVERCPRLQVLLLRGCTALEDVGFLGNSMSLEILDLSWSGVVTAGLCNLGQCQSLRELYLNGTGVVNLHALTTCASLKVVDTSATLVDHDTVRKTYEAAYPSLSSFEQTPDIKKLSATLLTPSLNELSS